MAAFINIDLTADEFLLDGNKTEQEEKIIPSLSSTFLQYSSHLPNSIPLVSIASSSEQLSSSACLQTGVHVTSTDSCTYIDYPVEDIVIENEDKFTIDSREFLTTNKYLDSSVKQAIPTTACTTTTSCSSSSSTSDSNKIEYNKHNSGINPHHTTLYSQGVRDNSASIGTISGTTEVKLYQSQSVFISEKQNPLGNHVNNQESIIDVSIIPSNEEGTFADLNQQETSTSDSFRTPLESLSDVNSNGSTISLIDNSTYLASESVNCGNKCEINNRYLLEDELKPLDVIYGETLLDKSTSSLNTDTNYDATTKNNTNTIEFLNQIETETISDLISQIEAEITPTKSVNKSETGTTDFVNHNETETTLTDLLRQIETEINPTKSETTPNDFVNETETNLTDLLSQIETEITSPNLVNIFETTPTDLVNHNETETNMADLIREFEAEITPPNLITQIEAKTSDLVNHNETETNNSYIQLDTSMNIQPVHNSSTKLYLSDANIIAKNKVKLANISYPTEYISSPIFQLKTLKLEIEPIKHDSYSPYCMITRTSAIKPKIVLKDIVLNINKMSLPKIENKSRFQLKRGRSMTIDSCTNRVDALRNCKINLLKLEVNPHKRVRFHLN